MATWRPIAGFEGLYEVSDDGRVRNAERGRELSPRRNPEGYGRVALSKKGRYYHRLIHRLVAETFIPNPENLPLVLHGPRGVGDNSVRNLSWGTPSDNQRDRVRDGTDQRTLTTHCVNGHEYTEENTYWAPKTGSRSCRKCRYNHNKTAVAKREKSHG